MHFNRLAAIAKGGDPQDICVHAFLQLRLRQQRSLSNVRKN
jgi:hypothetical protein